MNDPKLEHAPIQRPTLCHVGCHAFTFTSGNYGRRELPEWRAAEVRCDCGAYSYAEWRKVIGPESKVTA